MWVFQDGVWTKDKMLWNAIRDASWDGLVLDETFLENLRRDTRTFFENRQTYKDLSIVWKRGILLLGPPGNGKTESIKVLLNESGQTALYVKSFTTRLVRRILSCLNRYSADFFHRGLNMACDRYSIMLERTLLVFLSSRTSIRSSPRMYGRSF